MGLSIAQQIAILPRQERLALLASLPEQVIEEMNRGEWWFTARPEQRPTSGPELIYLYMAGRGAGKSRSGSEWIVERVQQHPFDRHGIPTEWLVVADTLSDARTINADGPSGIRNVLIRRRIDHRYKQTPRPMFLFPDGQKIYLEGADDEDTGRGYNAAGILCVAADQTVVTDMGRKRIDQVRPGDMVLTRDGWQQVTAAACTGRDVPVVRVTTTSGSVVVTAGHRVRTNRGWVRASELGPYDMLYTCQEMESATPNTRLNPLTRSGETRSGTSTSVLATTTAVVALSCTGNCGQQRTGPSRTTTRSTTSTASAGTTEWRTCDCLPGQSTEASVPRSAPTRGETTSNPRQSVLGWLPTGNVARTSHHGSSPAVCAVLTFGATECVPSTARGSASEKRASSPHGTRLLGVEPWGRSDVYDLTVSAAHSFFAGSGDIEVHNCDEIAKWVKPDATWYEGLMPSLRADLIGDHPRAFVTTTPKPIKLLQEWLTRDDGTVHVITGSTFDNSTNLSAHVLNELKKRYHGTLLGEQELYGKLIELSGGGLFNRSDILKNRVTDVPDAIVSTVVGMDPNLTGNDAETGIVVACRAANGHLYVLADRTIAGSGRQAALAAWRAVAEFGADMLAYEENLGKRYLQEVLQDAYLEMVDTGVFPRNTTPPMKPVHASHGKKTRAEPVAMRGEQGRLHMVGEFPELEDQMVLYDPQSTRESPDRMDAMVHACLQLILGEKREMRIADPSQYDLGLNQSFYDLSKLLG